MSKRGVRAKEQKWSQVSKWSETVQRVCKGLYVSKGSKWVLKGLRGGKGLMGSIGHTGFKVVKL